MSGELWISGPDNKEALVQILGLIRIRIYCVEILYLIKCHIFSGDGIFNLWENYIIHTAKGNYISTKTKKNIYKNEKPTIITGK